MSKAEPMIRMAVQHRVNAQTHHSALVRLTPSLKRAILAELYIESKDEPERWELVELRMEPNP